MAVDFSDYFWGEKNEGFSVLYQNMKFGVNATKELADFFKERARLEEENSKVHAKLSKQFLAGSSCGSFSPLMLALKFSTEKLSNIHNQWSQKMLDLVKEVVKYSDELNKTHKQVKDEESATSDAVKALQDVTVTLQKSHDLYKLRCQEMSKLKKSTSGGSAKELEKSETKFRKAQEDYRAQVDKYSTARSDFERKMTLAAKHFQDVEAAHLRQMREFIETFCQVVDNNNNLIGRVYQEFQIQITELTVENLLEQFAQEKKTGLEKPGVIEFDEEKISLHSATGPASDISDKSVGSSDKVAANNVATSSSSAAATFASAGLLDLSVPGETPTAPTPSSQSTNDLDATVTANASEETNNVDSSPGRSPHAVKAGWTVSGFLKRNKRKKTSTASNIREDGAAATAEGGVNGGGSEDPHRKSETPTPEVDEDGFSRQPTVASGPSDPWADFNQPSKTFDSSSDESDDESRRKIKVEIKPVRADGAATPSFDELSSVIGRLELAPPPVATREGRFSQAAPPTLDQSIKRSQSQNQINLPSQDLLGLSLHPIDPIDGPFPAPAEREPSSTSTSSNAFGQSNFVADFKSNLDTSTTSKEVQDILGGCSTDQLPALPPKQSNSQIQREQISNSLIALPRPPSRMGSTVVARPRGSPSPAPGGDPPPPVRRLSRFSSESHANSSTPPPSGAPPPLPTPLSGSLSRSDLDTFRTPFALSRGPSPLTLGMSDVVPLAVAFQEVCHVCFRGVDESQCQVRLIGDMMISFPAGVVQVIATNPSPQPLVFKIRNSDLIESVVANKTLITLSETLSSSDSKVFEFDMKSLKSLLRKQAEQNPNASYFNLDLLKYQVKAKPGAGSCPLQLVAYWKCSETHTDLRLDYKFNAGAMASSNLPLLNLSIAVPVSGGVTNMQSQPTGQWIAESGRALWKFPELSQNQNGGVGSLRGRFQLSSGPGSQGTIAAQFNCEGTTLSGIDFELVGHGYRLSLVKRRFVSGKYVCDGDASVENRYRYAAPQSIANDETDGPSDC